MANKLQEQQAKAAEHYRNRLLAVMARHVGSTKKIGMGELFESVFDAPFAHRINDTRRVRLLVTDCRVDGYAICSDTYGYWLASAGSELTDYCRRLERQALRKLMQSSRLKKVALPDLLGQLRLDDDLR